MDKDEILTTTQVGDDIICKDCIYRNDGAKYPDYRKANCGVYREGIANKPMAILFEGGECAYYEKE